MICKIVFLSNQWSFCSYEVNWNDHLNNYQGQVVKKSFFVFEEKRRSHSWVGGLHSMLFILPPGHLHRHWREQKFHSSGQSANDQTSPPCRQHPVCQREWRRLRGCEGRHHEVRVGELGVFARQVPGISFQVFDMPDLTLKLIPLKLILKKTHSDCCTVVERTSHDQDVMDLNPSKWRAFSSSHSFI